MVGCGRSASVVMSRANRVKARLESALEATMVEVEDVSYQHAGHAAVRGTATDETHFNVKIVTAKFNGQTLLNRHRLVYNLLSDELHSGLHALSIVAKTPEEAAKLPFSNLHPPVSADGLDAAAAPPVPGTDVIPPVAPTG